MSFGVTEYIPATSWGTGDTNITCAQARVVYAAFSVCSFAIYDLRLPEPFLPGPSTPHPGPVRPAALLQATERRYVKVARLPSSATGGAG